jgi:hypothetical protein
MKKIIALICVVLIYFLSELTLVEATPNFDILSQTQTLVEGITHRHIIGQTRENGSVYPQVIQYLSANQMASQIHVVTGDDYPDLTYGMRPLHVMAQAVDQRYDNYRVIGGINGDFYNLNSGIPVEAYVRNGEVVSRGLGNNRPVVGFKDDGEVVFGRPCFEGFELTVFNRDGDIRIELPITRINRLPNDLNDITVYFENFSHSIPSDLNKFLIQGTDIKRDAFDTRYYGRGTLINLTQDSIQVPKAHFVIVSNNSYLEGLIENGDTVRVQEKIGCDFAGVRFAIGVYEHLVENGEMRNIQFGTAPNARVPRSAIGKKADGSIFFLAVDGRQGNQGRTGVTLIELAEIMVYLGADEAYNLDGGGSTSMVLRENDQFNYLNMPSDPGGPRALSNALFFVTGYHQPSPHRLEIPDLRQSLSVPSNIRIEDKILIWDHVFSRSGYRLKINDQLFNTPSNQFDLKLLRPGRYKIQLETTGEGKYYKDSGFSDLMEYIVYPESYKSLLEALRFLGRGISPHKPNE